jgi:hypothetical protein
MGCLLVLVFQIIKYAGICVFLEMQSLEKQLFKPFFKIGLR